MTGNITLSPARQRVLHNQTISENEPGAVLRDFASLLDLFGFVSVWHGEPETGKAWSITRIFRKPLGDALFHLLSDISSDEMEMWWPQARMGGENPSVGIILCKSKDRTIVEYALREIESAGSRVSDSLEITLRGNVTRFFNGMAQYRLASAHDNTSGITYFPSNTREPVWNHRVGLGHLTLLLCLNSFLQRNRKGYVQMP